MKCGHDGGSYAATRGNPSTEYKPVHGGYPNASRNVIGYAPGMPNLSSAADQGRLVEAEWSETKPGVWKADPITPTNPIPGSEWGFNPKEEQITINAELIAAEISNSESPRKQGFNYGVGWGPSEKPSVYFDGVRIGNALNDISHDASKRAWAMTIALRNVRLAETDTEKAQAVSELSSLVADYQREDDIDLRVRMLVNALERAIEEKAPSNPSGYIPHMGLQYAFAPVKAIVAKIKAALA